MKTSWIVGIIVVLLLGAGAWYYMHMQSEAGEYGSTTQATDTSGNQPGGPSQAMGTNGSPNQGNMGGADTGTPQQPGGTGDGTSVAQNLVLAPSTSASLGQYLSAYNGMTVYTFTKDKSGTSTCYGQCAVNWPPYTVKSTADIHVPISVHGKVGTITRADGSLQVTYNGMPLYFWKSDTKPGDTTGQGVGGVWYVVKP
jgi:predicted lipoprotein with Yx(FWY)xxD motif